MVSSSSSKSREAKDRAFHVPETKTQKPNLSENLHTKDENQKQTKYSLGEIKLQQVPAEASRTSQTVR